MNILIVSQLETLWMRKRHLMRMSDLRSFITYIYEYSIEHYFDKVIITRTSELPIEDAFALFEEFAFDAHGYGEENYEDMLYSDDVFGKDYIDHPLDPDKIVRVSEWMRELASHNVSMYCLEQCENTEDLRIGLRDGVGVRITELNSILV